MSVAEIAWSLRFTTTPRGQAGSHSGNAALPEQHPHALCSHLHVRLSCSRCAVSARPKLSLGLPPSRDIVRYAKLAEPLGYERVWLFDSPALYEDLWMAIARLAEATTIGLG